MLTTNEETQRNKNVSENVLLMTRYIHLTIYVFSVCNSRFEYLSLWSRIYEYSKLNSFFNLSANEQAKVSITDNKYRRLIPKMSKFL